jgi:hypothetical protein
MEIMFSMKIKKDGKTVQVLLLCTECKGELEMAAGATIVQFRCRKHGELGTTYRLRSLLTACAKPRKELPDSMVWGSRFE